MGASEPLTIHMEKFQSSLVDKFKGLRTQDHFLDCTIVCGKSRIKAHRVVLSAWSPVLGEIIKSADHHQPVIYLRGFRDQDLRSIIDFMYCGEAQVLESDLEKFLDSAKDLKVQGLSTESSDSATDEWNLADGDVNSTMQAYTSKPGNKRIKQEALADRKSSLAANLKQEAGSSSGNAGRRSSVNQSPAGSSSSNSDTQDAIKSLLSQSRQTPDPKTPVKYVPSAITETSQLSSPLEQMVTNNVQLQHHNPGLQKITVPVSTNILATSSAPPTSYLQMTNFAASTSQSLPGVGHLRLAGSPNVQIRQIGVGVQQVNVPLPNTGNAVRPSLPGAGVQGAYPTILHPQIPTLAGPRVTSPPTLHLPESFNLPTQNFHISVPQQQQQQQVSMSQQQQLLIPRQYQGDVANLVTSQPNVNPGSGSAKK